MQRYRKLKKEAPCKEAPVPAVPASWRLPTVTCEEKPGDVKSCDVKSGDALVVEAMGMQLGALAQATSLLATAASSSATPAAISDSDLLANVQDSIHDHLAEVHRDVLDVKAAVSASKRACPAPPSPQPSCGSSSEAPSPQPFAGKHKPRKARARKRGSGRCKKAQKAGFSEAGQAFTLLL